MDLLLQQLLQPHSGSHPAHPFGRGSTGWESRLEFNLLWMGRAQRVERREGANSRDVGTCWHGEGTFCARPGQPAQENQWRVRAGPRSGEETAGLTQLKELFQEPKGEQIVNLLAVTLL